MFTLFIEKEARGIKIIRQLVRLAIGIPVGLAVDGKVGPLLQLSAPESAKATVRSKPR
jgi:hypothetical protein